MHEMSLAQSILDIACQEAARHGAGRIGRVNLLVGKFTHVAPSQLAFCFDMIKKGSVAEGAELAVTLVPLAARCPACGREELLDEPGFICPGCGEQMQATQGQELWIDSIEVEDQGPAGEAKA